MAKYTISASSSAYAAFDDPAGRYGYRRLTLEEVARHAGTTKPAIYRRWPSRQRLVLAALTSDVEIERAVEALLRGIATDYPTLLEHSRRVGGEPELHHRHA